MKVNLHSELHFLFDLLTPHKQQLFLEKVAHRTKFFTFVLESLTRLDNASAIMRTADVFGFQQLHVVPNPDVVKHKPVSSISKGSEKWLSVAQHDGIAGCFAQLKQQGYTVLGLSPHHQSTPLVQLDLHQKTAFVLGNEKDGLSPEADQLVDGFVHVPMVGFGESLNVSVTAAIVMHHLRNALPASDNYWQLSEKEEQAVLQQWAINTIPNGQALLENWRKLHL